MEWAMFSLVTNGSDYLYGKNLFPLLTILTLSYVVYTKLDLPLRISFQMCVLIPSPKACISPRHS